MHSGGYKTKKELKASVGHPYHGYDTSAFAYQQSVRDCVVCHVGPDEYHRKWYARVTLDSQGNIAKVK